MPKSAQQRSSYKSIDEKRQSLQNKDKDYTQRVTLTDIQRGSMASISGKYLNKEDSYHNLVAQEHVEVEKDFSSPQRNVKKKSKINFF